MYDAWHDTLPVLEEFSEVTDSSHYVALPDSWLIGLSDVVNSTWAIEEGRYKAVNLAGAGTISAVSNALSGDLRLFIFGGDGARFAVPAVHAERAADALSRVAMWAKRDLDLELRVATIRVLDIRTAGFDVRAAFWQASNHVRYAVFMGGGLEWAEAQLKNGAIGLSSAQVDQEPNLTGLSCQWGPVRARKGKIVSLIVRPESGAPQSNFSDVVSSTIRLLEGSHDLNPVPSKGPEVRWPATAIELQARVARQGLPLWLRRLRVSAEAAFMWLIFKFGLSVAGFNPSRYRRELAENTDYRKFDDALMMTIDCAPDVIARLRVLLDGAAAEGTVRYGLHVQDEALITCVVPSVSNAGHVHFVDGSDGGYTAAAAQLE
ncbi:MAG: DUF3095 domain-containing protein [Hyphomicrobiaceae bacterium]